jgi:GNAT superfamily N-acetyltransferase
MDLNNFCIEVIKNTQNIWWANIEEIYLSSFPSNEMQPLDTLKDRINTGFETLVVLRFEDEVVGFSLLYRFSSIDFFLLDYLAISQKYRNKGFGTRMFKGVFEFCDKTNCGILMEVDDPSFGSNYDEKSRRVSFYKNNGAKIIENFNYILPALDHTEITLQILMYKHKYKVPSKTEIKEIIKELYTNLYGLDEDDKNLKNMLENLNNAF